LKNDFLLLLIHNSLLFHRVINYGATWVVVPKIFLIGCLPIYLAVFQTNSTTYDKFLLPKGID